MLHQHSLTMRCPPSSDLGRPASHHPQHPAVDMGARAGALDRSLSGREGCALACRGAPPGSTPYACTTTPMLIHPTPASLSVRRGTAAIEAEPWPLTSGSCTRRAAPHHLRPLERATKSPGVPIQSTDPDPDPDPSTAHPRRTLTALHNSRVSRWVLARPAAKRLV
jgi:hypothetical protein